jgi:hypothetical protein
MARKVWTAEEVDKLSREQQQAIFDESIVTDLADVPPTFLTQVRADAQRLIERRETQRTE